MKRFGFHSNSQGADEIKDFPISIDFQIQKLGIVTPVQCYNSMLGFKVNKRKCNFHYVTMPMMMSEILKSVDFTKTQKSRYLKNETLFFL